MKRLYRSFGFVLLILLSLLTFTRLPVVNAEGESVNLVIWDITDTNPEHADKYVDNWGPGLHLDNFLPGAPVSFEVNLKNNSTDSPANLNLKIRTPQLSIAEGDYFQVQITDLTTNQALPWTSFTDFRDEDGLNLDGFTLGLNESKNYKVEVRILPDAPASLSNRVIDDLLVYITGFSAGAISDEMLISYIGINVGDFSTIPTPTDPPTPTPTDTPTPTPTDPPTPTATPTPKLGWFSLLLVPQCSDSPFRVRNWKVVNTTNYSIPFTWETIDSSQTGNGVVGPKSTVKFSTQTDGRESLYAKISWGTRYFSLSYNPVWKCDK